MIENVIPLPGGGSWVVRAFEYPTSEEARLVWEKLEEDSRGKQGNFSLWRTTTPDRSLHLVIVCGRPEHLPGGRGYAVCARRAERAELRPSPC